MYLIIIRSFYGTYYCYVLVDILSKIHIILSLKESYQSLLLIGFHWFSTSPLHLTRLRRLLFLFRHRYIILRRAIHIRRSLPVLLSDVISSNFSALNLRKRHKKRTRRPSQMIQWMKLHHGKTTGNLENILLFAWRVIERPVQFA